MKEQVKTENKPFTALFVCFGGMSNTGYTTALAAMRVVEEVGADRVRIMCLAGLPAGISSVRAAAEKAHRIVTIDGCPNECALAVVRQAGFAPDRSITLTRDAEMQKVPVARAADDVSSLIKEEQILRASKLIYDCVL